MSNRGQNLNQSTHVINVEIKDNHEDALLGGRAILQLAQMVKIIYIKKRNGKYNERPCFNLYYRLNLRTISMQIWMA